MFYSFSKLTYPIQHLIYIMRHHYQGFYMANNDSLD